MLCKSVFLGHDRVSISDSRRKEGMKEGREEGGRKGEVSRFVFFNMYLTKCVQQSPHIYHIRNKVLLPKIWPNHCMRQEFPTGNCTLLVDFEDLFG